MTIPRDTIDWLKVEYLCGRSFTGTGLREDEQAYMEKAFQLFPDEYRERTRAVRAEERKRIQSM